MTSRALYVEWYRLGHRCHKPVQTKTTIADTAQSRDDLAACTEWFRVYQGGIHAKSPILYGILFAGYTGARSYMDAEILITSLNGEAAATNAAQGKKTLTASRVKCAQKALDDKSLVGVIAQRDASNKPAKPKSKTQTWSPLFPVSMPPEYESCVVDWFFVTDVWPEQCQCGIVWMVRLQKQDLSALSYWALASDAPPPLAQRDYLTKVEQRQCATCQKTSPFMFEEKWLCRNEECSAFWNHPQRVPRLHELSYSGKWLQQREYRDVGVAPPFYIDFDAWYEANYLHPMRLSLDKAGIISLSKSLTQGFRCPLCRMLNRRVEWRRWACRNPACSYERPGPPPVLTIDQMTGFSPDIPNFATLAGYKGKESRMGFTIYRYEFTKDCKVSYCMPSNSTNAKPGGSDSFYSDILRLANAGDISLQRKATKSKSTGDKSFRACLETNFE
jgi:hypothetical protein